MSLTVEAVATPIAGPSTLSKPIVFQGSGGPVDVGDSLSVLCWSDDFDWEGVRARNQRVALQLQITVTYRDVFRMTETFSERGVIAWAPPIRISGPTIIE